MVPSKNLPIHILVNMGVGALISLVICFGVFTSEMFLFPPEKFLVCFMALFGVNSAIMMLAYELLEGGDGNRRPRRLPGVVLDRFVKWHVPPSKTTDDARKRCRHETRVIVDGEILYGCKEMEAEPGEYRCDEGEDCFEPLPSPPPPLAGADGEGTGSLHQEDDC